MGSCGHLIPSGFISLPFKDPIQSPSVFELFTFKPDTFLPSSLACVMVVIISQMKASLKEPKHRLCFRQNRSVKGRNGTTPEPGLCSITL